MRGGAGYIGEAQISPAVSGATIESAARKFDNNCKEVQNTVGSEIITSDNIILYDCNPKIPFGINLQQFASVMENGENNNQDIYFKLQINWNSNWTDKPVGSLYKQYKIFCLDIDGINEGEDPFGYGIRWDGKIVAGKRAQEWLAKEVMEE